MRINAGLDTGDIIGEAHIEIAPNETNQSLTNALIATSSALLTELLPLYVAGSIVAVPQPHTQVTTYSRKLTKTDSLLDTNKPATVLEREIRAFSDWPKSRMKIGDIDVIVTSAVANNNILKKGVIYKIKDTLVVGCRVGSLEIVELMPIGKKPMSTKSFLNGYGNRIP